MNARSVGGYPIGTRRRSALAIKRRNEQLARAESWMRHIPDDPRELVAALREAGVDLDGLREVLR